jgi:nucleoside-diphosphate-sugar epimerase
MSSQSVLLIGASGYLGHVVAQEFLNQKLKFARIAILAEASKVDRFTEISQQGMEIVIGSFLEPSSFKGKRNPFTLPDFKPITQYSNFSEASSR